MKNIWIKIKKYLKINLVLFFVLGVFTSIIINGTNNYIQVEETSVSSKKLTNIEKRNVFLVDRINELLTDYKKELILDVKEVIGKEDEILEIRELDFSHTDFNDEDGSLNTNLSEQKLILIKDWLNISNLENKIRKSLIKNIFNNDHQNIIRLVKWLITSDWIILDEFSSLLSITEDNPLYSQSFNEFGVIKDEYINDLNKNQYDAIKRWLGVTENTDELVDKKSYILSEIKNKILLKLNVKSKKKIIKFWKKQNIEPDIFFQNNNFEINFFDINGRISSVVLDNLLSEGATKEVENLISKLEKYNNFINFLNDDNFRESLKNEINKLLTGPKKELIIEIEIEKIRNFELAEDLIIFLYNMPESENLTIEKFKLILIWLKSFNSDKISKFWMKIISNKFNENHRNIIRLTKWLESNFFINFDDLLAIKDGNPFSETHFWKENGNILNNDIFFFSFPFKDKYIAIKKWLGDTSGVTDELIDKEIEVIQKIKEKLANHFNTKNIAKRIIKFIFKMDEIPINFFKHNFQESGIDTGLTKESFGISINGTGEMLSNASWNIELNTTIDILNKYKPWIDSLNEEKYKELLINRINKLLTNNQDKNKNYIKLAMYESSDINEFLGITKLGFSHTDFKNDGSLKEETKTNKTKLESIENWLSNLTIKNVFGEKIEKMFHDNHKNIIRLALWLKQKNWISEEEFNQLLEIIESNPFSFDSFNSNTGELKENKLDDLSKDEYDVIKKWLGVTENTYELIDKKDEVIQKIKEKLSDYFNNDETRMKIIKLIQNRFGKTIIIFVGFFNYNFEEFRLSTGLGMNDFDLETSSMESNASWNITLGTTLENLNKYKSWIENFINIENKLWIHWINKLLTNQENKNKNYIELVIKESSSINKFLGITKLGFSHTDFNDDGSLKEETKINKTKLESIENWLLELTIYKNVFVEEIEKMFDDNQKNIIRLAFWLKQKNWISEEEFNQLLGIIHPNSLSFDSFDSNTGELKKNKPDDLLQDEYDVIKKWLGVTENTDELVDKKDEVIQKIKEKLIENFNVENIRKLIAKLIIEINIIPFDFFADTTLTKDNFELSTGSMVSSASLNIILETPNQNLNNYISWIDSLNEEKYKELLEHKINELLENNKNKNFIKLVKNIEKDIDKALGLDKVDGISHTDFDINGLLRVDLDFDKNKLLLIKNWLSNIKNQENFYKNKIKNKFSDNHRNIIRLAKWLKKEDEFNNLLGIIHPNSLSFDSFEDDTGELKENKLDNLSQNQYDAIWKWINISENKDELIDKKNIVIQKVKEELVKCFNHELKDKKLLKKTVKLILEIPSLPDNFFKYNFQENGIDTGLTKESFEIMDEETAKMKFNASWTVFLERTDEELDWYEEWINSFNQDKYIELLKYLIKNKFNDNHRNIIRLAKWLKKEDEFDNLLGIKNENSFTFDSFNDDGELIENELDNLSQNQYNVISKWLDITDDFSNELIDKEIKVIQKVKEALVKCFNDELKDKKLLKKTVKLILEIPLLPDNFFKYNFQENGIDTGLTKESFEIMDEETAKMKLNASWTIFLERTVEELDWYEEWITSFNQEKYIELLKHLIKFYSKDKKEIIIKAKENPNTANETLGLDENSGFSHTDFNDNGLLIKNNFNEEKLTKIKNWLFVLEEKNIKKDKSNNFVFLISLVVILMILLTLIASFLVKNKQKKNKKIIRKRKNKK